MHLSTLTAAATAAAAIALLPVALASSPDPASYSQSCQPAFENYKEVFIVAGVKDEKKQEYFYLAPKHEPSYVGDRIMVGGKPGLFRPHFKQGAKDEFFLELGGKKDKDLCVKYELPKDKRDEKDDGHLDAVECSGQSSPCYHASCDKCGDAKQTGDLIGYNCVVTDVTSGRAFGNIGFAAVFEKKEKDGHGHRVVSREERHDGL